jgi:hypothetical protein
VKEIFGHIGDYFRQLNKTVLATCTVFTGLMIFINFFYGLDSAIEEKGTVSAAFFFRYLVFLVAFTLPYMFYYFSERRNYFNNLFFTFLILVSPAIFSWKMAMSTDMPLSENYRWNYFWNQIIYWPMRLAVLVFLLFLIWKKFYPRDSFFGFTIKNFSWKPYVLMLLMMIPLIAMASTQPDFLSMYPKLNDVTMVLENEKNRWAYHLLHELAYGSDFISVELFFRGFLILAFIKIAGKDAILPMACFYCTIHFGKPLGECISSYFGGILLGIVVYNTRSIIGGLFVHLGIAWLMEIGGYIGNAIK